MSFHETSFHNMSTTVSLILNDALYDDTSPYKSENMKNRLSTI